MGSFKDIDVLRRNLERAQGYTETAQYEASNAASEASDAEDNMRNVSSVLDDLAGALEEVIGFDPHDAEIAMRNIKVISKVLDMYIARLDAVLEGSHNESEKRFAYLVSMIETLTSSDSFGNTIWDTGYIVDTQWVENSYQYVIKPVKEEENNG
jgi:hypothetical protein